MSTLHVRYLSFCEDPKTWCAENGIEVQDIVDEDYDQYEGVAVPLFLELGAKRSGIEERAFPEFRDHREVMSQVYSELVRKGLLNHKQINDPLDSVISPLGKQFLNFIRFPDEPKKVDA